MFNRKLRDGIVYAVAAASVCAGSAEIWRRSMKSEVSKPGPMEMISYSGSTLDSFFDGLPALQGVTDAQRINDRRRGVSPQGLLVLAEKAQRFLGFGAVVHASDVCASTCHEVQYSQDCGCGTRYYTLCEGSYIGYGVDTEPMCTDCSSSEGGYVCCATC